MQLRPRSPVSQRKLESTQISRGWMQSDYQDQKGVLMCSCMFLIMCLGLMLVTCSSKCQLQSGNLHHPSHTLTQTQPQGVWVPLRQLRRQLFWQKPRTTRKSKSVTSTHWIDFLTVSTVSMHVKAICLWDLRKRQQPLSLRRTGIAGSYTAEPFEVASGLQCNTEKISSWKKHKIQGKDIGECKLIVFCFFFPGSTREE